MGETFKTADKRNIFSEGDAANWSFEFYTVTEFINDTIPSYHQNNLPKRWPGGPRELYNEALLKNSALTFEENQIVMHKLNLF